MAQESANENKEVSINELEAAVKEGFSNVSHLEIINEANTCSNMKITVIIASDDFVDQSRIDRHRMVQAALKKYIDDGTIHAVTIKAYTEQQWQKKQSK